ncbi:MAG: rRNA-processing protein and EBNA1-binding protein ebp2 [Bogoriella megaspora]|nr:MAG: rRNA-processing protein and EBNA1-binding protein ebp2 [Bogoriella megaspora]
MKYKHRQEEMERNRLKNLANPNHEKKQVKYDRERKKREEKRNLRMQAIINGMEIDMSYLTHMSNRQRKKEEERIAEAKRIREERLQAIANGSTSRGSSPPSSDDEDEQGGIKLEGEADRVKDGAGKEPSKQSSDKENSKDSEKHRTGKAKSENKNKKRKSDGAPELEENEKSTKQQKRSPVDDTSRQSKKSKKAPREPRQGKKTQEAPTTAQSAAEQKSQSGVDQGGENESQSDISEDEEGDAGAAVNLSRLDDSESSHSSDEDDAADEANMADTVDDLIQGSEIEDEDDADDAAEEDIPLSDLESLASEERGDIIPHQRLSINNHAALKKAYKSIALPYAKIQFSGHMVVTTAEPVQIKDINDDLNRELALYKQALESVKEARSKLKKEGVPFSRPTDYFAEMVKSDEHMGKIKQKLVDEAAGKKAASEARKQRDLKKFGKQVQIAKQQERAKEKRDTMDKINTLKRKRQNAGLDTANEDELFDVALEDAAETEKKEKAARKAAGAGQPNAKRRKKNERYGSGGKKKHAKSNDANSTNDMSGFSVKKMKGKTGKPRPGKSKRAKGKR